MNKITYSGFLEFLHKASIQRYIYIYDSFQMFIKFQPMRFDIFTVLL